MRLLVKHIFLPSSSSNLACWLSGRFVEADLSYFDYVIENKISQHAPSNGEYIAEISKRVLK